MKLRFYSIIKDTIWNTLGSNKIAKAINGLHEGGIGCVYSQGDGHFLTGGKDRKVIQWDANFQKTGLELEVCVKVFPFA